MEKWTNQALILLKEHNLKHKDVAAAAGMSAEHLSRLLNEKRSTRPGKARVMGAIERVIAAGSQGVRV